MTDMPGRTIKKVVLLGHNGFIGTHLTKAFARALPGMEFAGCSFPEFDLTRSGSDGLLKPLFDEHTAVIMCSALKRQFGDSLDVYQKNIDMCLNVARAIEASPVARLIFFSSMAVYGEDVHNLAIDEDTRICTRSYYGLAKHTGELVFERVFSRLDGACLAIRPPTIYGPGDMGNTYGPAGFLKAAREGREIVLWGDGSELREFLYIDDVVEIVLRLLASGHRGAVNVTSGQSYAFRDILDILGRTFPQGVRVASRPRSKDKVDNASRNTKIRQWLGEFDFTPLEKGMRRMYEVESQGVVS